MLKKTSLLVAALASVLALTACEDGGTASQEKKAKTQVEKVANARSPVYIPRNNTEYNNYNEAQKLYDSPTTIIWCTTTWANPSSPMVTVPVAGKLTSSSTTYFRPEEFLDRGNYFWQTGTARSVDGMFHPNPPGYRYGFTPGGQYVDFYELPTFCTTSLTKFQRKSTSVSVSVDQQALRAQASAEQALKSGKAADGTVSAEAKKRAQSILEKAVSGE